MKLLIRHYVLFSVLSFLSFIRAELDLNVFADHVREFAAQIEDQDIAATLESYADKIVAKHCGIIQQIHVIGDILLKLRGQKNALELILDCIDARDYLEEVPHEMLKKKASDYFSKKFPEAEIEFSYKQDGRQLGDCIHILQPGCPEIIYHIKTHSYGLCADLEALDSREAESVRFEELFVYKFLEHSGLGPEVHFLYYNEKDFYIATKDVGCTESGKVKTYTYEAVKADKNLLGIEYPKLPFEPSQEVAINSKVIQCLVCIDTITRIFGLEDLITNPGNFYFICDLGGNISDFKIIDFHVGHRRAAQSKILYGLLIGVGPYCLGFSDTISRYLFVHKDEIAKIETTKAFFIPMASTFTRAMERSFKDMQLLIKAIPTLNADHLEEYFRYIVSNVNKFVNDLQNPSSLARFYN